MYQRRKLMYRFKGLLIMLAASHLVACSSKEKASTTLRDRSDYEIPFADLQGEELSDELSEKFQTMNVRVWEFDYSNTDGTPQGGREITLSLSVPKKEFERFQKQRRKK